MSNSLIPLVMVGKALRQINSLANVEDVVIAIYFRQKGINGRTFVNTDSSGVHIKFVLRAIYARKC